jgi:Ser-tRNA(Ala) deacylase AlaX
MNISTMTEEEKKDALPSPTLMIHLTFEGNFELECDAKLLSFEKSAEGGAVHIQLDRTTMHPQGGGQPTDKGTLKANNTVIQITKVTVDRASGIVTHAGTIVAAADGESYTLEVGQSLHVSVDADERLILSECHTAGHVVDSAMARCGRALPATKGYHFLDGPYVEYKGKIAPEEKEELLGKLQTAFQELVAEDIETKIETMSKEDAEAVCNRVQENVNLDDFGDGDIRIVTIAGWPCPCGGTHVRSTKYLKERKWGITGIRNKKGIVRVKYGQNVEA